MKYKIAACTIVFLAGMAAGWYLNSHLPQASRNSVRPPAYDTSQSRIMQTDYSGEDFKSREYIRIFQMSQKDELPEVP